MDSIVFDNITRTGSIVSLREAEYTAVRSGTGIDYEYTEIHSDGMRAVKVHVDRRFNPIDSEIIVTVARVGLAADGDDIQWVDVPSVSTPAYAWHPGTVAHSEYSAPSAVATVANELVNRTLGLLGW